MGGVAFSPADPELRGLPRLLPRGRITRSPGGSPGLAATKIPNPVAGRHVCPSLRRVRGARSASGGVGVLKRHPCQKGKGARVFFPSVAVRLGGLVKERRYAFQKNQTDAFC